MTTLPDRFGAYGGRYVPETLMMALQELEASYTKAITDPDFLTRQRQLEQSFIGRPTPLYFAEGLTRHHGGASIWLKREDLCHTGAHKINNALGQVLLAVSMGKRRVIAETGAGQHGVATATAAARFGLPCVVYMGTKDMERQSLNVYRMRLLGAEVRPVEAGSKTLKEAVSAAIRDWVTNVDDTHYVIGSVVGPHPFPTIVRDLQSVIGRETRAQCQEVMGGLPDTIVACVGGGSNSMGMFFPFLDDDVRLVGVEAGGQGLASGHHAASLLGGRPGVLHGSYSYVLQDAAGQIMETDSISAGLDYPGVGPEHSDLKDRGRAEYVAVTDVQAMEAFHACCRVEGIIPALESSHALFHAGRLAAERGDSGRLVVCLSGRGDKDLDVVRNWDRTPQ